MSFLSTITALAPFLGAGATAGLQIGAGRKNRKNARYMQEQQNIANMNMAEYAYSKDLEQWNRANAYNTPAEQMKRLKEAGINPHMVYGSGSVSQNAVSSPSYNAPRIEKTAYPRDLSGLNALAPYLDISMRQAQVDNVKANTDKIKSDTAINDLDRTLKEIEVEFENEPGTKKLRRWSLADAVNLSRQKWEQNRDKFEHSIEKMRNELSIQEQQKQENELKQELLGLKIKDMQQPLSREDRGRVEAILAIMQGFGWIDAKWINDFLKRAGKGTLRDIREQNR